MRCQVFVALLLFCSAFSAKLSDEKAKRIAYFGAYSLNDAIRAIEANKDFPDFPDFSDGNRQEIQDLKTTIAMASQSLVQALIGISKFWGLKFNWVIYRPHFFHQF